MQHNPACSVSLEAADAGIRLLQLILNLSKSSGPIKVKSTCNRGPESEVLVAPVFTGFGGRPPTPKI